MDIKYNNKSVHLDGKVINFDYDVADVGVLENKFVVLLKIPTHIKNIYSNIYALDFNGKVLWSVQAVSEKFPKLQNILPFESMNYIDNYIYALDFYGRRFKIDPNNGKILEMDIVK